VHKAKIMANRVLVLTGPNLNLLAINGHEHCDAATRNFVRASLCRLPEPLTARYALNDRRPAERRSGRNAFFRREPFRLAQFAAPAATGISWRRIAHAKTEITTNA
jgi:hypothetical protein